MQNRFNNDFEHFVKQNADQYRMFPSDKVWKGIHNTLHTRRRWYGIGLALLLLTTGVVTWVMLVSSNKSKPVATTLPTTNLQYTQVTPGQKTKEAEAAVVIVPAKSTVRKGNSFTISTDDIKENLLFNSNDENNIEKENSAGTLPTDDINGIIAETPAIILAPVTKVEMIQQPESSVKKTATTTRQATYNNTVSNKVSKTPTQQRAITPNTVKINIPVVVEETKEVAPPPVVRTEEKAIFKMEAAPYTIESVINSYRYAAKRKRISLQAYITPTISYRELKENKPYIEYARNATPGTNSAYYTVDINNVVTHKPDLGLQMGFSAGYPLSKKLKLIGGLQFNISKYDIKAYEGSTEMATITLNNPAGGIRSVSTLTNYRNLGGDDANWLHNLYFSVSAPVGLELKLAGNRKSYLGIAGTLQPTYIISNRSYVISADYKNYAEVPSLTRKVNLNTGFEMFAGSSTGKIKWRVGPQVRYQAMSSFENKYPVKEHLFDFGLKLGIMLNK